jgi:hypothetical protein
MRLTLRTILAYVDDMLEPAQAREIGAKIAESKEAAALMARIKEVGRRRRIGVPELAGPGSGPDPNLVADYLENILPPNQVVEMERLAQASDLHLAEIAACHKILTMVMGQPIDVPDEMRERMAALGAAKAVAAPAATTGDAPPMAEGIGDVRAGTLTDGLPEYLTRNSFWQRYGVLALVVLIAICWMVVVLRDDALWPSGPIAKIVSPPTSEGTEMAEPVFVPPAPGQVAPAVVAVTGPAKIPQSGTPAAVAPPQVATASPAIPPMVEPVPLPVPPMPNLDEPEATPPAVETVPQAAAGNMPAPAQPAAPAVAVAEPVLPLTKPELPFRFQSGDELVIKKMAAQPDWRVAKIELPVDVEDEIASPAPFRNVYGIANAIDVTLEPGTRIKRILRMDQTELGLALDRGQLTLLRPLSAEKPVAVLLQVLGRNWIVTLLEPGTRCGIELSPPVPNGPPMEQSELSFSGGVVVVTGHIQIGLAGQKPMELGEQDGYARWPAEGDKLITGADLTIPSWALPDGVMVTPAARQLARLYQKEFSIDRPISQGIGPVAKDRRAGIAELAVKTLALIDQYQLLVPALGAEHQEARVAAIQGLRQWLPKNPENEKLLRDELGRIFRAENVDPMVRLLWGFRTEDAQRPEISRQLVDWLKDDQIAIRELAFFFINRLTGRTYDFLPMAPAPERRAAVARWEDYLKRNGGALLPQ